MTKTYMEMRPNEIHNRLMKRIPEPEVREMMKDEIARAKKIQRAERLSAIQRKKLWGALISPLRYEISNVKVGLRHEGKNLPERHAAFSTYLKLMEKLLLKFEALMLLRDDNDKLMTPSHVAREMALPSNGVHWTDWIPQTKRVEVCDLFEHIPYTPKAKRKIPFQRTQRPNTKLKDRLLARTLKELGNEETEQMIAPTSVRAERIKKIKHAIKSIQFLKPTDAVPHTWHGLNLMEDET